MLEIHFLLAPLRYFYMSLNIFDAEDGRSLESDIIGVGRGGAGGGGGGGRPPNNLRFERTCKTIPFNSILEFSILSDFKMRNVIIWH